MLPQSTILVVRKPPFGIAASKTISKSLSASTMIDSRQNSVSGDLTLRRLFTSFSTVATFTMALPASNVAIAVTSSWWGSLASAGISAHHAIKSGWWSLGSFFVRRYWQKSRIDTLFSLSPKSSGRIFSTTEPFWGN